MHSLPFGRIKRTLLLMLVLALCASPAFAGTEDAADGGQFVSFVLLDSAEADLNEIARNLREDWGIDIPDGSVDTGAGTLVATVDGWTVFIGLMPSPVPNGEAAECAHTNLFWADAVPVAEAHKAHLIVGVLGGGASALDTASLHVKLCAACLEQPAATGIYTLGTVLEPGFYVDVAKEAAETGGIPLDDIVFFSVYTNDGGKTYCGYTYGLSRFGKMDMEVLNSAQGAQAVLDMLYDIAAYVLEYDALLLPGQTIGYTAEQKLSIIESEGVAVEGNTLKIGF